ncbi:MAG TPA: sigma-54 dependent transcriptional regulator [Spirochaetota bacterium]|jgi:two-component system response regulator AtoC|nr:MAG: Transcriptional regulatory protein ZraR [Spirochaetes bacterium ADurb.Bin133]HNZ27320.1 sigma-54 dependent transcriptional regulator [Spirochaetota bacterium]HPY86885.1 sigma-54 dependent transcriptional regulator [Spirochaetota bacterium]HQB61761.1 sigma-54 dependent transcriptional regulator [Spirochaetota bacterium]
MKILIVDDEQNIRESISKFLKLENYEISQAANGLSAKRALEEELFDLVILDLKIPGITGLELLEWMQKEGQTPPTIMISAYGEIKDAVNAMKLGAKDYLVKPFDPEELLIKIKRVASERKAIEKYSDPTSSSSIEMIGNSIEIMRIKENIKKIANTSSNVLITGASGTGKEIAARLIHDLSLRRDKTFYPINIGGIPENLLESELFGYEKGAFTGANSLKKGIFEVANGGTLFLDEIGDMPLFLQVKILRTLQDRKIQRLGATQLIPLDLRIISATNKEIETEVKEGKFREDLYYRLNVAKIHLPPLKDRIEDVAPLVRYFIEKFNKSMNKNIEGITEDALEALKRYDFPGNIRELENIIERVFIFCEGNKILLKDIESNINLPDRTKPSKQLSHEISGSIKDAEKRQIILALQRWDGNRTKAAEELGISRRTLINKIKYYDITTNL